MPGSYWWRAPHLGVQPPGMALPDGCAVADYSPATLLPGLIDTHVHLCGDSGPGALDRLPTFSDEELTTVIEDALLVHLAVGVTTVRDLGDRLWAVLNWRDRHQETIGAPTVLASGPPITSPGGHCWNMGGQAQGVRALRRAVRERAERGVDIVKIMASGGANTPGTDAARPQFSVEELRAVVEEAHAGGLVVTAHAHPLTAIRDALAAGVDAIEHCTFITATGIEVPDSVVAALAESAIPVCPTLGAAPGVVASPAVLEFKRKAGLTDQARAQTVGRLHRAGVHLVSGSDGGITPGKRHGVLPEAVSALVDGDVSPTDALASATARAAVACGVGDRKGRVAAGFDADLLIVDGDPSPISAPTKGRGCLRGWTAALCLTPADRCAALPTTGRPKKRLSPRRQPRRRSVASRRDRGMPDRGGLPGGSASGWTYAGGTFRR
jgi:imidazolonepropionase-like amidohydrolase